MPHLTKALFCGAVLAVSFVPSPVFATHPGHGSVLELSVTSGAVAAEGGAISSYRTVVLSCDPPEGPHPRAVEACARLARTGGRIESAPGDVACTMEYVPVTVAASGHWRGVPVRFQRTYGNVCVARATTGVLFDF
ncbi:hypothetical protein GCM10027589_25140 [Actinocorallia lasiicapitis]